MRFEVEAKRTWVSAVLRRTAQEFMSCTKQLLLTIMGGTETMTYAMLLMFSQLSQITLRPAMAGQPLTTPSRRTLSRRSSSIEKELMMGAGLAKPAGAGRGEWGKQSMIWV